MILREQYNQVIKEYFSFLKDEFNYYLLPIKVNNTILYNLEYTNQKTLISISYEIMGEGINVIIFELVNGKKSDYDDYEKTFHLNQLSKQISQKSYLNKIKENNIFFEKYDRPIGEVENEALKKARLLRLVLKLEVIGLR